MLKATEIREAKFSKSMGGYKQEEVDILLDKIEADYAQFERTVNEFQARIDALNKENEELKASQTSIQNVLLSAQSLADRIVSEAKEKSEEIIKNAESNIAIITAREKELSTTFELKAQERKATLEKELNEMVAKAQLKAESITKASEDSVARQQVLFDRLKMEIAAFKAGITNKYKEHLEVLNSIPDTVPMDPKYVAEVMTTAIDKAPDVEKFIPTVKKPEPIEEIVSVKEPEKASSGFVVNDGNAIEDKSEE